MPEHRTAPKRDGDPVSLSSYQHLIEKEQDLTPHLEVDDTLRIKVVDICGMTCHFCHNEGTPVASKIGLQAHRVSVYEETNDIPFTQADIGQEDSESFSEMLQRVRDAELAEEVHWTGGEPTLARQLPHLTSIACEAGYRVKMTSNGQTGERRLKELADAGLTGINFSIFGTTPQELANTQGPIFKNNLKLAESRLSRMGEAMMSACSLGISTKANIVISGLNDIERGLNLLEQSPEEVKVRFQADTNDRETSTAAIYELMQELGAIPVSRTIVAGCSVDNYDYTTPEGRVITFKRTRPSRLPGVCDGCPIDKAGQCHEGYYGIRLYKDSEDDYWLSPCIQKMDSSERLDDFLSEGGLGDKIRKYRERDLGRLQAEHQLDP